MAKKKAIIIIGGGYLQLPQIRWAKELGLYVIVTDRNEEALGSKFADRFELIGGTDIPGLLEMASQVNKEYNLVGAYASSDFGLPAVSEIADNFNLPGCSLKSVQQALNKSVSKKIFSTNNLPVPQGKLISDYTELLSEVEKLGLPVIIKPVDSSGSQGVTSVENIDKLEDAFHIAKRFSSCVLVEQLVQGVHIDVNAMFVEDKFIPCGTMERFFSEAPYHYPLQGCEPSSLTDSEVKVVYDIVERASRCLGIDQGPVKADLIYSDRGPVLIELASRFHGDVSTSHVTPLACNTSPVKAWLSFLSGDSQFEKYLPGQCYRYAGYIALFPSNTGVLREIKGVDKAKAITGISDVYIRIKLGDKIQVHKDNTSICGFIWATGSTKEELQKTLVCARDSLFFEVE